MNDLASNASDGWESIAGIYAFSEGGPAIEHLDGISSKHDLIYFSTRTVGPRVHEIFGNMASAEPACRATPSINPITSNLFFLSGATLHIADANNAFTQTWFHMNTGKYPSTTTQQSNP